MYTFIVLNLKMGLAARRDGGKHMYTLERQYFPSMAVLYGCSRIPVGTSGRGSLRFVVKAGGGCM